MTRGAETNRMMLGPEKHTIKIVVDEKTGETHVVGLFDEEFKKKMALKAQINTFGFSPDVSSPDEYFELIRPVFNFWFGPA